MIRSIEQGRAGRAEGATPPAGRHYEVWSVWRDPMTWALGAAATFAVVMTILG